MAYPSLNSDNVFMQLRFQEYNAAFWWHCVALSEQYSSGKDSTCANLQMVLMLNCKSFGDKYEKSVVLIMQRFLFTQFVLSFIIHTICLTNLFQKE